MTPLYNILSIARYERMMLFRTTRFRVLGAFGMAVPVVIGVFLAILDARGVELPNVIGLGAFVPFYVYSYLQTVVIAFVVGDFRAGDERAHVHEVIDASPVSTAELVVGKYLGGVTALAVLSFGVLLLTVVIQAAKISVTGIAFTLEPYLIYLLVMTLPALLFVSSLTFFLASVLRKQTAVALTMAAYTLAVLLFLGHRYDGIFDFGAFFAPLFYSDLLGVGDISKVLVQRFVYVMLSVGLLGLSILRYPRLKQSGSGRGVAVGLALVGFGLASATYGHLATSDDVDAAFRASLLEEYRAHASRLMPVVTHYEFEVTLAKGSQPIVARSVVSLHNTSETALDTLVFSLNPGLRVTAVEDESGEAVGWSRGLGLLHVAVPMRPGQSLPLTISYEGHIDPNGFDLLRSDTRVTKSRKPFIKGDMTAWVRPHSVFLPPRSGWYPVPGVAYGSEEAPSYATARTTVDVPDGVEVITQGREVSREAEGGRVRTVFAVDRPLAVFSLNTGIYERFEGRIHDVDVAFYLHPAHLRQVRFFEDAEEEVMEALDQMFDAVEQETGLTYPHDRLSVVEVPFQVQWYYEGWNESGGLVQPGVLMVEEDVLMGKRFRRDFDRRSRFGRGNQDPSRVKRDLAVGAVLELFFSKESARDGLFRSPIVQLWSFDRTFAGEGADLLERGLPLYMQGDVETGLRESMFTSQGGRRGRRGRGRRRPSRPDQSEIAAWDTLMASMKQRSFSNLDPETEPELYRRALDAKGSTLFKMVEAVVGDEAFLDAIETVGGASQYGEASFASFETAIAEATGREDRRETVKRMVDEWLHSTHVPGYTLTRATATKMDDGWGVVVYQVTVRVKNAEPGRGYVQIRVVGREDEASKAVEIEGGTEIEVGMIIWDRPFRVVVDPFFARNRRAIIAPLRVPDRVVEGLPSSYVKDVSEEASVVSEIIVDNEDDGFDMPVRRVTRYLRPGLKGGNWSVRELPASFGRYETNFRWKRPGDGAQPAVWTTKIPHEGNYDVAYYFPPPRMTRRLGLGDRFEMTVTHGVRVDTLEVDREHLKAGWNLLGRFRFEAGEEARVELSDRSDGRLYADAVRWRYFDPNDPDASYEEALPSWNFGGFGRGGGRGPGQQGDSRQGGRR